MSRRIRIRDHARLCDAGRVVADALLEKEAKEALDAKVALEKEATKNLTTAERVRRHLNCVRRARRAGASWRDRT